MAKKQSKCFVAVELESAANTYEERNAIYGDTYKRHGHVMSALFPDGIAVDNPHDMNRLGVLNMIVGKLTRYATNFDNGGHKDSLHDLSVYAAMLNELDHEVDHEG
jgi:hypothetical protein